jgi:hypothetical protein
VKIVSFTISLIIVPIVILWADNNDWSNDSWGDENKQDISNSNFEKMKIKNRSKREYDDKVYKYITGDYKAENNNIELATIHLDDKIQNSDIDVNVLVEDLKVEGDSFKDSIDIKQNKYKNFVKNDEKGVVFFEEEEKSFNKDREEVKSIITSEDPRYSKVPDEDISELEMIDLRDKEHLKEVNVFIEDVNILVD